MNINTRIIPTESDKRALLFIAEQGFSTIEQLWRVAWKHQKTVSYTYDRLRLLEKSGFLKSLRIDHSQLKIYRATQKSRYLVAQISQNPLPITDLSASIAVHQLELNEVRIALESRGITSWRSAESLLIDPLFKKIGGKHVPDGFYVSLNGVRTVVEYDRTLRKKERIRERFASYLTELMSPDRTFDRLVYLVSPSLERIYSPIFEQGFRSIKDRAILITLPCFLNVITTGYKNE